MIQIFFYLALVPSVYGQSFCSSRTSFCSLYAECYSLIHDAISAGNIIDGGDDGEKFFLVVCLIIFIAQVEILTTMATHFL